MNNMNMLLYDVHAHLSDNQLSDVTGLINRAKSAGVKSIITNGLGPSDNKQQLNLSTKYDIVRAALGFYPSEAETASQDIIKSELNFIRENKKEITAIGEIGLDRKDAPTPAVWKKQVSVFKDMVALASEIKRPIIIHSRKAEQEVLDILKDIDHPAVIMHCFSGKMKLVKEGLDRGYFFSIPPIINTSTHFQAITKLVDFSHLMTETDTPYLSPFKDKLNESAFIDVTIKKISEIKGTDAFETSKILFKNFLSTF